MTDFSFYFSLGWEHIMSIDALDHILFVLVLTAVYLLHDWKKVLVLVTAFTIGHSITLALSTLNLITVRTELVEFLIPCTIVFTAIANLFQKSFKHKAIRFNYFLALFFWADPWPWLCQHASIYSGAGSKHGLGAVWV